MNNVLSEKCFEGFQKLIYSLTGISIEYSKSYIIEGRLRKRLRDLGFDNFTGYLEFVKKNKQETGRFIDLITTHETSFFRTPRIWKFYEKMVRKWSLYHANEAFSTWSAAASTGEEAYTAAMICESVRESCSNFSYSILGSDISSAMIEKCQSGKVARRTANKLRIEQQQYFNKYITASDGDEYSIKSSLAKQITFSRQNLFESFSPKTNFNVILLRNVLIYFDREDQYKLLSSLHKYLDPRGFLIVGESETLRGLGLPFEQIEPTIYSPLTEIR